MEKIITVQSEAFDNIVEDIKQRNLSINNMPKLIIGTGLSIIYEVPGMWRLAEHLNNTILTSEDNELVELWKKRYEKINKAGLEAGLKDLTEAEQGLLDAIKKITARFILDEEEKIHDDVMKRDTGFSRLLQYLAGTVSANNRIIDIMTPNYDRIIELVCDKCRIGVITGFSGSLYCKFDRNLLKTPVNQADHRNHTVWVRLFKPHGSINWLNENDTDILTNNYRILSAKADCIDIVTPGSSKFKAGMTNNTFRVMREEFNDLLGSPKNHSLLIYGYGFNDEQFDVVLFENVQKNILILSKDVQQKILDKAMDRKNITVFYQDNGKDYMIYQSKKYSIDMPLWNIDRFAEIFIG